MTIREDGRGNDRMEGCEMFSSIYASSMVPWMGRDERDEMKRGARGMTMEW